MVFDSFLVFFTFLKASFHFRINSNDVEVMLFFLFYFVSCGFFVTFYYNISTVPT